jgi:hypothetical protein
VTILDLTARRKDERGQAELPVRTAAERAGVEPATSIDGDDNPMSVIDLLFLTEFTRGAQPYARHKHVARPKPKAPLYPAGAQFVRTSTQGHRTVWLHAGDGWTLRTSRWRTDHADLTVTAVLYWNRHRHGHGSGDADVERTLRGRAAERALE